MAAPRSVGTRFSLASSVKHRRSHQGPPLYCIYVAPYAARVLCRGCAETVWPWGGALSAATVKGSAVFYRVRTGGSVQQLQQCPPRACHDDIAQKKEGRANRMCSLRARARLPAPGMRILYIHGGAIVKKLARPSPSSLFCVPDQDSRFIWELALEFEPLPTCSPAYYTNDHSA